MRLRDGVWFYRVATLLPFALTVLGALLTKFVAPTYDAGQQHPLLAGIAWGLMTIGTFACIPYGLYLIVVAIFMRPTTERDYRRAALLAPLVIAPAFAIFEWLADPGTHEFALLPITIAVWGIPALVFGYLYVLLILAMLTWARRAGWIT